MDPIRRRVIEQAPRVRRDEPPRQQRVPGFPRARSQRPKTEADIDQIVKSVIDDRLANGQLDDTDLSLHDLQLIRESFVTTLKGVFHPRIEYPAVGAPPPIPALPAPEKPA